MPFSVFPLYLGFFKPYSWNWNSPSLLSCQSCFPPLAWGHWFLPSTCILAVPIFFCSVQHCFCFLCYRMSQCCFFPSSSCPDCKLNVELKLPTLNDAPEQQIFYLYFIHKESEWAQVFHNLDASQCHLTLPLVPTPLPDVTLDVDTPCPPSSMAITSPTVPDHRLVLGRRSLLTLTPSALLRRVSIQPTIRHPPFLGLGFGICWGTVLPDIHLDIVYHLHLDVQRQSILRQRVQFHNRICRWQHPGVGLSSPVRHCTTHGCPSPQAARYDRQTNHEQPLLRLSTSRDVISF